MNQETLQQLHELASIVEGALASTKLMVRAISEKVRRNEGGCQKYELDINTNLRYVDEHTTQLYERFAACKLDMKKFDSSSIEDEILEEFSSLIRAKKVHSELESIAKDTLAAMKTLQTFSNNIEELLV